MRPLDDVLAAFKADWLAGTGPDIDAFLAQLPRDQHEAFVDLVDTWLTLTPDPELQPGVAEARIAADPALGVLAATYAAAPGTLAELVPQLRAARRWSVGELAGAFVDRLGLPGATTGKVSDYLERVERGDHDAASLSRRALDALGELLGVGSGALTRAALPAGATPAAGLAGGARFRTTDGDGGDDAAAELQRLADALRTPTPAGWDVVDELFCAGM
jgi:hypothetical protein